MSTLLGQLLEEYGNNYEEPVRVMGIDLGTTNSAIAEIIWDPEKNNEPRANCFIIPQEMPDGTEYIHELVPSAVALFGDKVYIGEGAKQLRSRINDLGLTENKNLFYEVKNDIGVRLSYGSAPANFNNATEISAHILNFLFSEAHKQNPTEPAHMVITVPASFQLAQRSDTFKAAELAGFDSYGIDLVDEPLAALIDYLITYEDAIPLESSQPINILLFDYGGGTCDIALLKVSRSASGRINASFLSVSRYHRLGGGDIDRAVFYECLLPQLIRENNLDDHDLTYDDKKKKLEPAMLTLAENLKIKINDEVNRLRRLGRDEETVMETIVSYPGIHTFHLKEKDLTLTNPQLSAEDYFTILEPFTDWDLIGINENEYRSTCSIFAPIIDAIERCNLEAEDIGMCLMVGGSSLLVPVKDSLRSYFYNSNLVNFKNYEDIQLAVARGAAYQALAIALNGIGFIDMTCHEDISIKTDDGRIILIPKGTTLPYPDDNNYALNSDLRLPRNIEENSSLQLKLEIVGGDSDRLLYRNIWNINGPARSGDNLSLEYRYDKNQILHLIMSFRERNEDFQYFEDTMEKPLTNVVNPNETKQSILVMEEELRQSRPKLSEAIPIMKDIAKLYAKLGQYEKALDYLRRINNKQINNPDAGVLNLMGIYYGELDDYERQEKFYLAAANASSWKGPLFNLALQKQRRKLYKEGLEIIENVLGESTEGPDFVLAASLWKDLGDEKKSRERLISAFNNFEPLEDMEEWELTWYRKGARMLKDEEKMKAARQESTRRSLGEPSEEGVLPSSSTERR